MSNKIFFLMVGIITVPLFGMEAGNSDTNAETAEPEQINILRDGDEIDIVQLCHHAVLENDTILIDRIIDTAASKGMEKVMQCLDSYNISFDNPLCSSASKNPLLGVQAIHVAACNGQIGIAEFLIGKGINISSEAPVGQVFEKLTPADFAIINNQHSFISFVTKNKGILNHVIMSSDPTNPYHGLSSIHIAAITGNIVIMKQLLEQGISLESTVTAGALMGATPFVIASKYKNLDMMEFLLARGAKIDAQLISGITALHLNIQEHDYQCVEFLLAHGASVHTTITNGQFAGYTSLHLAAHCGSLNLIDPLLNYGAKINAIINNGPREGFTPLGIAAIAGKVKTAQKLIWRGARIDRIGPGLRKSVIDYTSKQIIKDYLSKHAIGTQALIENISLMRQYALFESMQKKLLKRGHRPLKQMQRLSFMAQINQNRVWTCYHLIRYAFELHHADPHIIDRFGFSPLFYFIAPYDENQPTLFDRVVYQFIKHGADVNVLTPSGYSPLTYASAKGNLRLVNTLLAHKTNPADPTIGINPVSTALFHGFSNLVEKFCQLAYQKN